MERKDEIIQRKGRKDEEIKDSERKEKGKEEVSSPARGEAKEMTES